MRSVFRILVRALICAPLLFTAPLAWAGGFVPGVEDLPLAPELTAIDSESLSFDTPQGRIVVAAAQGTIKRAQALAFYAAALPQLGWERLSDTHWRRDGEELRLDLTEERRGPLTLRFSLQPAVQP